MLKYTYRSTFEGKLAKYYDAFFWNNSNPIKPHVDFIEENIKEFYDGGVQDISILDVGCGTGIHAFELCNRGYQVDGIDISKDMISVARSNGINRDILFQVMDMCIEHPMKVYDVVISMSHVIGYQLDNIKLRGFVDNINRSMKIGGIFMFNFYHAPALYNGTLQPREKSVTIGDVSILRFSNATKKEMDNVLELRYKYILEEEEVTSIDILEYMRYFTVKELDYILQMSGFEIVKMTGYLNSNELSEKEWNGFCVVRKVKEVLSVEK